MAKLLLIQTLFLTIYLFAFVSGTIKNKDEFKKFIINKVVPIFRSWARNVKGGEQFAVLMLSDTDRDWNTFKLSPTPSSTIASMVQPAANKIDNYVAVLPGYINNQYMHSEQRIYENYLENMWKNYKQKHGIPKAMILYSWIVPCQSQTCPSQGTTGCTSHTIQALKKYTKETEVVIAFTTKGSGTSRSGTTTCDAKNTKTDLKAEGFDVVRVWLGKEEEQEAMIESLVKLGRLMQILE